MNLEAEIEHSVQYLAAPEAAQAFALDGYWPKWNGPWWHMLLLHEVGLAARIPQGAVEHLVAALRRVPLTTFPIRPEDVPPGVDPYACPCHCQLGCAVQVLHACGVDVDRALPWVRPWFLRYQMADGGLNCDSDAYLVEGECPSSMVGTIGAFEAILLCTPRDFTAEERTFLQRGAEFLMARELRLGSSTKHNAGERVSAEAWDKLCFPRFYFYDVLRGLRALSVWAEVTKSTVPASAIREVLAQLETAFPDGTVRIGRLGYENTTKTRLPQPPGQPSLRGDAAQFPLLERVSPVGAVSPFLSAQWGDTRSRIERLGLRP